MSLPIPRGYAYPKLKSTALRQHSSASNSMVHRMGHILVCKEIESGESQPSFRANIRLQNLRISEVRREQTRSRLFSYLNYSLTSNLEAACFSETSVKLQRTKICNNAS
jgi:hypothetical protein